MSSDGLRCWAEVDTGALAQNIRFIRRKIGGKSKIIGVVKANGYGHELGPMVGALHRQGLRHFGVASPGEAFEAREAVPHSWIILLSGSFRDEIPEIIRRRIVPTVSSWYEAEAFARVAVKMRRTLPVHLKIDTGMGRLGIWHEAARVLAHRRRD
jgi:alanine racemase